MTNIPLWIFWILIAAILLWKAKPARFKEYHEDALSLENSKGLLGLLAILVVLHHLVQKIGGQNAGSLAVLENMGVCFVGGFFFFSGYGLFYSFKNKPDYLRGFLKKRMPTILVPFFVSIIIYMFANIAAGAKYKGIEIIKYLLGLSLNTYNSNISQMWYIVEIALFYILFYLIFRLIKNESIALTVMGVLVVVVMGFSLLSGHGENLFQGEWWYNASFLFIIGMIFAKHKDKIMVFMKKAYWVLLPACIIITVAFYKLTNHMLSTYSYWSETPTNPGYLDKLLCLSSQLPMVIFFVLSMLLLTMKIQFKNPVLKFLGTISLELYLIHNLFIVYFKQVKIVSIKNNFMYMLIVLLLSVLIAWILHGFNQYITGALTGRNKKNKPDQQDLLDTGKTTHNHSIDCFRIIASFLVVCIHIPFRGTMGSIVIAFGKIAVPFFLVVSGYFLYRDDNQEFLKRLVKQTKRILFLTLFANLLFALVAYINASIAGANQNFIGQYFTLNNLKYFLLYNMSPFADHLWYLGSLLYSLVILIVLAKVNIHKYAMFLSPALLGVYIYLSKNGSGDLIAYRNALIVTVPYLMMGCLIRRYEKRLTNLNGLVYIIPLIILLVTNVLEYSYYKTLAIPYYSAELLVYAVVLVLLKYPNMGAGTRMERAGKKYSLFIYIVHVIPILYFYNVAKSTSGLIQYFGPVVVFCLTYVAAVIFYGIRDKVKKQKVEAKKAA